MNFNTKMNSSYHKSSRVFVVSIVLLAVTAALNVTEPEEEKEGEDVADTSPIVSKNLTEADAEKSPDESGYPTSEEEKQAVNQTLQEMMDKLEQLFKQRKCSSDRQDAINSGLRSRPCFYVTSPEPVISQLCNRISHLEERVDLPASQYRVSESSAQIAYAEIAKLREEIAALKQTFAFSANHNGPVTCGDDGSKLKDWNALVNQDFHFNSLTGVLTVPYRGLYQLSLAYFKKILGDVDIQLLVDGVVMAKGRDDQQATLNSITFLEQGQKVWAEYSAKNMPKDAQISFTFSGFLVR